MYAAELMRTLIAAFELLGSDAVKKILGTRIVPGSSFVIPQTAIGCWEENSGHAVRADRRG